MPGPCESEESADISPTFKLIYEHQLYQCILIVNCYLLSVILNHV